MNLGLDNIRELLEGFLKNTGGRRGREREQRREEARAEAGGAQPADGGAGDAVADASTGTADASTGGTDLDSGVGTGDADGTESAESAGTTQSREDRPDPEELGDDEAVDELFHRLESLEDELDRKESTLGTIQDSQEHVADQVEDVNDTIRQLLGVYDQLTNDVNPFTGDGETDGGFDVFGEKESGDEGFGLAASARAEAEEPDDETVSFDDLKSVIEEAAEDREESDGRSIPFDAADDEDATAGGDDADDDTRVEVQATERVDDGEGDGDGDAHGGNDDGEDDEGDVTLDTLANTYASDVIVFEWLTDLVRTAGPSATLRAISYYHEIGWIEEDVKEHLEAVLSGPDLDIHVDPGATPQELTAEDHADSYTYIMKLKEVHEAKGEVGS